mmetsp:Transcript_25172/g.38943  ORF Transcript_25172/g.38943 Transcript_25172/m.38943 type:complete len:266 (-) Transcript_25172:496-1293(-)
MDSIQLYCTLFEVLLHAPYNYLFIHGFSLGFKGAAVATSVSQTTGLFVVIIAYVFVWQRRSSCRSMFTFSTWYDDVAYKDIIQHALFIIPDNTLLGPFAISKCWAMELMIFSSGALRPGSSLALSDIIIYIAVLSTTTDIIEVIKVGCSARLQGLFGTGKVRDAQFASSVGLWSTVVFASFMSSIVWIGLYAYFPSLIDANDESVQLSFAGTGPFLALLIIVEGLQSTEYGILWCTKPYCIGYHYDDIVLSHRRAVSILFCLYQA